MKTTARGPVRFVLCTGVVIALGMAAVAVQAQGHVPAGNAADPVKPGVLVAAAAHTTIGRDAPPVVQKRVISDAERRAQALLDNALQHIKNKGPEGAADFSRESQFVDHDLYVYALTMDGVLLGSGGWSVSLVGQNVLSETDARGEQFFQRLINLAREQDRGEIQYYWYNPAGSFDEPKVTNFVRHDDVIIAAGYYPPRATRGQAQQLLRQAVSEFTQHSDQAFDALQDPDGQFVKNDLYVFVVRMADGQFVVHGGSPGLVGTDAFALLDASGRNVVREMADIAQSRGKGELDYFWINPMTGRIESKRTHFRMLDNHLIAVGNYN